MSTSVPSVIERSEPLASAAGAHSLDGLVMPHGGYRTIVADPPWEYGAWGKPSNDRFKKSMHKTFEMPYPTMSVDEICKLPVASIAAESCDLYLWTTQKYLPNSFRVVESWGFRYCQTLTWCKTPRGTGQGGLYCPTTEFVVLARKGKMPKDKKRVETTWWNVKRPNNAHSKKPEYFQDVIEGVSDAPRIELFARRKRLGWTTIGNEADGMDVKDSLILLAQGKHPCYGVEKHGERSDEKTV